MGLDDGVEVDVGQDVAGDDHEGVVELGGGVADRSRRPQRRLLGGVAHLHAELGAVAEVVADVAGQEGDGDHDVVEAVVGQAAHDMLHQRPVGHGHHRLGQVGGERPQAGALAAGHHDGFHEATGCESSRCGRPAPRPAPGGPWGRR